MAIAEPSQLSPPLVFPIFFDKAVGAIRFPKGMISGSKDSERCVWQAQCLVNSSPLKSYNKSSESSVPFDEVQYRSSLRISNEEWQWYDDETNEPFEKGHLRYVGMVRESRLGNSLD